MGRKVKKWLLWGVGSLFLLIFCFPMEIHAGRVFTSEGEKAQLVTATEITLDTVDGIPIVGNLYTGGHSQLIIVLNGLLQSKDSVSKQNFCYQLARYFDVLNIDFRGRGYSGGQFTEGIKEVFDLQAAIHYAKTQRYTRIGVIGFSFGGYMAIKGSALSGEVDSIVTIGAPFGIQKDNAAKPDHKQTGLYKIGEILIKTLFGSSDPENCEESTLLTPYLQSLSVPLMIMHGNQDVLVPYTNAKSIFKAATERKALVILDGFNHAESFTEKQMEQVLKKIIPWFMTSLE